MADVPMEDHDIIIVGAGLSGINTAHVLREELPHRSFTILEKKSSIGGTWNNFHYPGFRSDSHMMSFGLTWFPWTDPDRVGNGPSIVDYLGRAADKDGTTPLIRFRHQVLGCSFASGEGRWRLDVDADGARKTYVANFVIFCVGYYSYDRAMEAAIPGIDNFGGRVVHPQWWPKDLDHSGKRVAIVGSGATAITLVPALAKTASSVTMVQRSPSYVMAMPRSPPLDALLHRVLPASWAYWLSHWIIVIVEFLISQFFLAFPKLGATLMMRGMRRELPDKIDASVHFKPTYGPFQQRVGLSPDGDFFEALAQDNCEVVTDTIDTVTETGITLSSGRQIEADVIVTATGLYFQLLDGMKPLVDGQPIVPGQRYTWRGMMLDGLPNASFIIGYVTSSWTPGANIMALLTTKLLKTMEAKGATTVVPRIDRAHATSQKLAVNASSGYFLKAADRIPKVTGEGPWYGRLHLLKDTWAWLFGSMETGLVYGGIKDKAA